MLQLRTVSKQMGAYWILLALLSPSQSSSQAGDIAPWQGKRCAVCLTYDDALNVHLDHVVPVLDSLGFRATFYIPGFFATFRSRIREWQLVARNGHELGNHTLFHPCEGRSPGREWVKPSYDLSTYTMERMVDEIEMANAFLQSIDGRERRTFAYPCGDTKAGDSSYVEMIKERFIAGRGVEGKMEKPDEIDIYAIGAYMINGQSGDELVALAKQAMAKNALVVFLFHGVGGEHSLNVSLEAHRQLLLFLKEHTRDIWVAPLAEIAGYLNQNE